jgi:hypothetical protein
MLWGARSLTLSYVRLRRRDVQCWGRRSVHREAPADNEVARDEASAGRRRREPDVRRGLHVDIGEVDGGLLQRLPFISFTSKFDGSGSCITRNSANCFVSFLRIEFFFYK